MQRVLVLFAHPSLERSRVNQRLMAPARALEGVTFHDLYQAYPELDVDVRHEQRLLVEHDVIVFHHPLYWYSAPPLVKQWQDLVLEHGWAYGSRGRALREKSTMHVVTCGGGEAAYQPGGYNLYTLPELLRPFEATANLCGMRWLPPFVVYGTHRATESDLRLHVEAYERLLVLLRDGPRRAEERGN